MPSNSVPRRSTPRASVGRPEGHLGYRLARARFLVTADFHDELARQGVPILTCRILTIMLDHDRTIREIADLALVKQSTLSRALDRLERDGLIARERRATERRSVYVGLTATGRALATSLMATADDYEGRVSARLPVHELEAINEILDRLIETLSK